MRFLASSLALVAPVVAQNNWQIIAANVATEATGISFNPDGKTGFMAAGINGQGSNVLKSIDGGVSWAQSSDPMELLLLDVSSYNNNVLAAATFSELFSNDTGNTFYPSTGGVATAAQCVRDLFDGSGNPIGFGIAGDFGLFNPTEGVAVSTDGGATLTSYAIPQLNTLARYASFVSPTTWYVSAGQWPESSSDQPSDQAPTSGSGSGSGAGLKVQSRAITERMSVHYDAESKQYMREFKSRQAVRSLSGERALQPAPNTSYAAQIAKTTNGGQTWVSQYYSLNQFYFNGIDCLSTDNCCAAAENDNTDATGGAWILCTTDGGANWNQTYYTNASGSSLLDLRAVDSTTYIAVGGVMGSSGPGGAGFLLSTDGGNTWIVDSVLSGYYATSVECAAGSCWATLIDSLQTSSVASASGFTKSSSLRAGARKMNAKERAIKKAMTNML